MHERTLILKYGPSCCCIAMTVSNGHIFYFYGYTFPSDTSQKEFLTMREFAFA